MGAMGHGGMGGGAGAMFRSFRQDPSVRTQRVTRETLRRIVTFARPYRGRISIFLVLIAIDAATGAALPLLYKAIIDNGIAHGNTSLVVWLAAAVAGLAVLSAILSFAERFLSSQIGEGLILDLRTQVFDHVQRMPLAFFSRTQTGALVQRLNGDVLGAQQAFTSTLSNVVSNVLTVIFVIAAMLSLSWQITLVSLVLLPVFILPVRYMGRKLASITQEAYNLNASMGQTMTERFNVAGAQLVKNYGRPDAETKDFAAAASKVRDIGITSSMYAGAFRIGMTLVASVAVAIVYGLGGVLAIQGTLTVGVVVALTSYLTRLYGPITALSNVQVDIMTTLVSFDRVLEVLDLEPSVADKDDAVDLIWDHSHAPDVTLADVGFRYPSASEVSLASLESVARLSTINPEETLHHVTFTVPQGRMVALVGPSGAGKTTISALISRMYDPTTGTVSIGGHDLRDVTQQSLHDVVGVVTQDAHLFHDSIRANLLYARPDASDAEIHEALRRSQALFVEDLPDGLDTVVGDRGYRLSGGERQRVAIARLLLKAPAVVVLDEATAHLDSDSEAAVQAALDEALIGRTSLVIAHRLSTVRAASSIVVLDQGCVVEQGTHGELLAADGLYAELYRVQFAPQAS